MTSRSDVSSPSIKSCRSCFFICFACEFKKIGYKDKSLKRPRICRTNIGLITGFHRTLLFVLPVLSVLPVLRVLGCGRIQLDGHDGVPAVREAPAAPALHAAALQLGQSGALALVRVVTGVILIAAPTSPAQGPLGQKKCVFRVTEGVER